MLNTERTKLSPIYKNRIKNLHDDKVEINREKLKRYGGFYNIDDHGFICFDDFKFEPEYPETSDPNGEKLIHGCVSIGKNLRKFLNAMPVYMNMNSALCGCWVGFFAKFANIGIPREARPKHLEPIWRKYGITQPGVGGMNHLGPDMEIGINLGFKGILDKIRYYRAKNAPEDSSFYDGEEELVLGILEYIERHADELDRMAKEPSSPEVQANYREAARINRKLLTSPPETFREVCQFLAHFQSVDRTYFAGGALGQLDELLRPFYEKESAAGTLTDDEAVWIIASLLFNDTHYSQLGGQAPTGKDLTSRVSFLVLDAMHELNIPVNMAVRVYEGMNEALLRRAVEYILEDGSGVSFSLSKGIEEGFVRNGHPRELARMRAKVGCNWVALPGREYPLQDVTRLNMAWAFLHALDDVIQTQQPTTEVPPPLENLFERFSYHLAVMVDCIKEGYDRHYEIVSKYTPEIVLNLFCHGTIERGLNSAEGGVDIMSLNCDGIALATVADSFAAIEQRVVNEGRITWQELYETLKSNYEGKEDIRLMLKNIPRFGNPDSLAEKWAVRIKDKYVELVKGSKTPKHHIDVIPGMFSHGDVYAYGKNLPATPNGRFSGDPISHSNEPDPGFARGLSSFSPSLKANAVALVQAGYGNSGPLHLDIDTDMLNREGGVDALMALIHTHEQMEGTLINLNCVTREQIMKAHENPENYPDLVVRVTGYSAFFASLSKEYRQQIVDRYLTDAV